MEPNTNPNTEPNPQVAEPAERTFTQAQLDAIVAREKAKATKGMFSADDMAAKDESIKNLTGERDKANADMLKVQTELNELKQRQTLLQYGVSEDDVEYYAFKIGKLVTDKKDFNKAAEEFFKDTKPAGARFMSTGGSVGGGNAAPQTTNDQMNKLIRNAMK